MTNPFVKQLFEDFQQQIATHSPAMNPEQLKSLFEPMLGKLDLVSRQEFDAQAAVLLRTREKLETLEKQLANAEAAIEALAKKQG